MVAVMIVVRVSMQSASWWRRLLNGPRRLRGCTMAEGSKYWIEAGGYADTLALCCNQGSNICVPKGFQLVVSVSDR